MSKELALSIEHVTKQYRLGLIGGGTLQGDLQSFFARVRGKEDPNSKVGSKVYKKNELFKALDDVSFSVEKGEAVGLIGHNGAGKSTLLKLISRVTAPTDGIIRMNGKISSMLEVGTGFHPELTGRENIYMNGAILGMKRADINERILEIIEFSECAQFIDTPVKRYSSGMYVKLAFSVAAHLNNDILIMDEVLAVGDLRFQKKCLDKMADVVKNDGKTIVYVSHNMNTIRRLCNRCVVLQKGRVLFDGAVSEGIGIYTEGLSDMSVVQDLSTRTRGSGYEKYVLLQEMQLLHSKDCYIINDKPIIFRIKWKCLKDFDNAYFRIILKYVDTTVVGMCLSEPVVKAKVGENYCTDIAVDFSSLIGGKYILDLYVTQTRQNGSVYNCDTVNNAFSFIIPEDDSAANRLSWNHDAWGSINLPSIDVLNSARIPE